MDNITKTGEPHRFDGRSTEAEYAIEHPLIGKQSQSPNYARALDLFLASVQCLQDGDESKGAIFYQDALKADPSLHSHACEALIKKAKGCRPEDEGAIYYWLGIHTQYLGDLPQAERWYAQAINAFRKIGYPKREGRAHCNLGRVKMELGDPTGIEEYEKAISLNPRDGIAHIGIGTMYYLTDEHERALDSFAEAIWIDPNRYSPPVIRRLQRFGYSWEEDKREIGKKIAKKQGVNFDILTADEHEDIQKAYDYFQIGIGYFQSGRHKEALEQFEKGKLFAKNLPGNFFGVSMTAMQMIELGVIPKDEIPFYLEKADQNIDQCLRLAPTNPDYQQSKIIIGEIKKKYHVV